MLLFLAGLLFSCSILTQNEKKECDAVTAYAGPALHAGIDTAAFPLNGPGLSGTLDDRLMARLDSALQAVFDTTNAIGVSAAVGLPGKGIWRRKMGLSSTYPDIQADSHTVFHIASVGKMFTAAAVLRLVEKDSLNHGDALSRWFPYLRNSGKITVEQLLTHTHGIANFNEDSGFQKAGYQTPEALLAIADGKGNMFCPGERWYYSNTGYVLLALILEKVKRKPFHTILNEDVIVASGLRKTSALAPNVIPPQVAVPVVDGKPNPDFNQSMPFGAGNVTSTAEDLVLFLHEYLSGRIIGRETLREAAGKLYPMFDGGTYYGQGLMLYEFKDATGKLNRWVGHSGGSQGEKAVVAYDLRRNALVSVIYNCDVSAEATALRLLSVLDTP
jgi:D-alanyl-D-alanine carboxypeptidase